jgi:hypothetical protein
MAELVAIDKNAHFNLRIDASKAEQHGKNLHMIPALLSEFNALALQYPLVLTKHGDTGQFLTVALLGFQQGENLFWQNNGWQGIYLPLQIQRQPFFVGEDTQSSDQKLVLCIDPDSPTISDKSGERLFNEDGTESAFFIQAKTLLGQILHDEASNEQFIQKLVALDLIQPLSLDIEFCDQSKQKLQGLYAIDQQKLTLLSAEQIGELHQQQWLPAIYAMILSLGHIMSLIDKKNQIITSINK